MRGHVLWGLILLLGVDAISYRCDNNQVLIVQNFGNDTIRMHCQRLNICGFDNLNCEYEHQQHTCGGKYNFVAHVNQQTATGPVEHTCCLLKQKEDPPSYDNDCFVYELPDGSHSGEAKNGTSKNDDGITVLKNANQIPEQFDGYVGYRMRLFMLRNKSPPTLIVKAIERVPAGYRVTICRPRCGKFANEGVGEQITVTKEQESKIPEGDEWAAAAWSSWQTSTWSTWSKTTWSAWEEASAENSGGVRSRAHRVGHDPKESGPLATAISSAKAENGQDAKNEASGKGGPSPVINNNVHVHAEGGKGGEGGQAVIHLPDEKDAKENETSIKDNANGEKPSGRFGPAHSDSDLSGDGWNFNPDENNHGKRKNKGKKGKKPEKNEDEDEVIDSDEEPEEKQKKGRKAINGKGKDGKHGNNGEGTDRGDNKEDGEKDGTVEGDDGADKVDKKTPKNDKSKSHNGKAQKADKGKSAQKNKGTNLEEGVGEDKNTPITDEKDAGDEDDVDLTSDNKEDVKHIEKAGKIKNSSKKPKNGKGKGDKSTLRNNVKDGQKGSDGDPAGGELEKQRNGKSHQPAHDGDADGKENSKKKGNGGGDSENDADRDGEGEDADRNGDDDKIAKDKKEKKNDKNKSKDGGNGKRDKNGDQDKKEKSAKSGDDKKKGSDGNKHKGTNEKINGKASGKDFDTPGNPTKGNGKHEKPLDGETGQQKSGNAHGKGLKTKSNEKEKNDAENKLKKPLTESLKRKNGRLSTHDEGESFPEDGDSNGTDGDKIKWTSTESGEGKGDSKEEGDNGNNISANEKNKKGLGKEKNGEESKELDGDAGNKKGFKEEEDGDANKKSNKQEVDGGKNGENEADNDGKKNNESEEDDRNDEKSLAAAKRSKPDNDAHDSDGPNPIGEENGFKQGVEDIDKQGEDKANPESGETDGDKKVTNKEVSNNENSKFSGIINEKEPIDSDESAEKSEKVESTTGGEDKEETTEGGFVVEVNAGVGTKSREENSNESDKETEPKEGEDRGKGEHNGGDLGEGSGEGNGNGNHTGGADLLPWCDELKARVVEFRGESIHEASGEETLGTGFTGIIQESSGEGESVHSGSGEEVTVTTTEKCRNRPHHQKKGGHGRHRTHGHRGHKPAHHRRGKVHSPPRPAQHSPPRDPNILQWQDSKSPEGFLQSMRNCFSGDTMVRTIIGDKKMEDLQVGDYVLVPSADNSMKFERVELFYHREPETYVKFVYLNTESGKTLSLTQLHLLPFGDCDEMEESIEKGEGTEEWIRKSKFAYKAQKGECLLTLDPEGRVMSDKILKVGRRYSKGIYSPVTVEGAIVTNDILASCFSQLESHAAQKMAFDLLIRVYNTFGYLKGAAHNAVQEVPIMLDYVHQLSWHILPFAKY